jgi:hypothetical protein
MYIFTIDDDLGEACRVLFIKRSFMFPYLAGACEYRETLDVFNLIGKEGDPLVILIMRVFFKARSYAFMFV